MKSSLTVLSVSERNSGPPAEESNFDLPVLMQKNLPKQAN